MRVICNFVLLFLRTVTAQQMTNPMGGLWQNSHAQFSQGTSQNSLPSFPPGYMIWGEWGRFGSCSVTCGRGIMRRQRMCFAWYDETPRQTSNGGRSSLATGLLPLILMADQSSDSGMDLTGLLTMMSMTRQGEGGSSQMIAQQQNGCPGDQIGSAPCSGPSCISPPTEFPTGSPPSSTFGPPITNNPPQICLSAWGPWGQCSSPCGTAIKLRTRECRCANPITGASSCTEMLTISQLCPDLPPCASIPDATTSPTATSPTTTPTVAVTETATTTTTTTLAQPMGSWGAWKDWKPCSSECGKTSATSRRRPCSGSSVCYGTFQEFQPCPFIACPDPEWSQWGAFGDCSSTCGGGKRFRSRSCSTTGGCSGISLESTDCAQQPCPTSPTPPTWGDWGPFQDCSKTCGAGEQIRRRICPIPGACLGFIEEIRPCLVQPCPTPPTWQSWGRYSACSKTCGVGERTRRRTCTVASGCSGLAKETIPCLEETCVQQAVWGQWSSFNSCSKTCGVGERTRTRDCSSLGQCSGKSTEIMGCILKPCPTSQEWSQWSLYGACSATCGLGEKTRTRECSGDGTCAGMSQETIPCLTARCPEAPTWTEWSPYSSCSTSCGPGERIRIRTCPSGGLCEGTSRQTSSCSNNPCVERGLDTTWNSWSPYTPCNTTCGEGYQTRYRTCPVAGACEGPSVEYQSCDNVACLPEPPPSEWGSWGPYSTCTATCGVGRQIRLRSCLSESGCTGDSLQHKPCTADPCPACNFTAAIEDRDDCGFPGISLTDCRDRGCCYDDAEDGLIWCFHTADSSSRLQNGTSAEPETDANPERA